MIDKKRCVVVIHVHKSLENYNENERNSLIQTLKVFGNSRHIVFMCPDSLAEEYSKISSVIRLKDQYFTYGGYNQMCKSDWFYQTFLDLGFKYMLLTQLDVWTFQDNLEYFLNEFDEKGYDYIGAPWYGVHFCKDGVVGNGGFCIRRLEKFRDICQKYPRGGGNEDVFFLHFFGTEISVAPESLGLEFSFEEKPLHAFRLNNHRLPMGCHAYASTPDRIGFWKYFIPNIKQIKAKEGNPDIYNPVER